MSAYKWQFPARFRRHAFGWRSDTPIQRIKEALSEINAVARIDAVMAAEGAIKLLEKLSPALEQVDSSSGALGTAVNRAIAQLVPLIGAAQVDAKLRSRWLDRLWQAIEDDDMPYIETLADHWGELCAGPELALEWAQQFEPLVSRIWATYSTRPDYFKGTIACLSAMLAAGRHQQLLALLEKAPNTGWHYRQWGVKALVALGKKTEAMHYAQASGSFNEPQAQIAQACEAILLSSGLAQEAYELYAIAANQSTTYLASFRAIAKKYPHVPREQVLRDLIASTPGAQGKWFAAAKDAGLFALATELARTSPTDPRTLTRAARDFAQKQPVFALESGLAALHWMANGYGYELTGADVVDAYQSVMRAAPFAGADVGQLKSAIRQMIDSDQGGTRFISAALRLYLTE